MSEINIEIVSSNKNKTTILKNLECKQICKVASHGSGINNNILLHTGFTILNLSDKLERVYLDENQYLQIIILPKAELKIYLNEGE